MGSTLHERLRFDFEYRGIEISPAAVALAHRDHPGINVELGDLLARQASTGWADLAICIEVLEHLSDPGAAVESIRCWTARDALVSVPWEPYFRLGSLLRGKHLGRLGIHPGHLQRFNPGSLRTLLARHFDQVRIVSSFPWLIAVAR